uniref:Mini-chromosome maintenance complex-binding protein n=2 Tax=Aceria tosichella TaxID=561515 RepID=A0A6G1SM72_9ACAR
MEPSTTNSTDKKFDEFLDTMHPEAKKWKYIEFRCMIQDILGSEIYGDLNSDKLGDRTIFYCITIPGENEWVRKINSNNNDGLSKFELSGSNADSSQDRLSVSLVNYSFPIPDGKNKSCLIKVYDVNLVDCLRVNDIVQVGGLIEPIEFEDDAELLTSKNSPQNGDRTTTNCDGKESDPAPTNQDSNNDSNTSNNNGPSDGNKHHKQLENTIMPDLDFEPAKDFPERLVPRIHVRTLKKLPHINPLLPQVITPELIDVTRLKMARARLSTILTQLLGGDSLTAEYLILSLISKIHSRRVSVENLGQLTMGLTGFKPEMRFLAEKLYELVSKITTHSHYIDLSIANLNNLRFTPKKDHENNKMIAGTLQLPDGLYLILNETALSEGLLTTLGTSNLGTLSHIMRWQKHKYDFQFHSVEIDTDLKILVICETKSILPVQIAIRIAKNDPETITSMRQACEAVDDFLDEDLLNSFRYYITTLMAAPEYKIPEDLRDSITEDFVKWRREADARGQQLMSGDELSFRMSLARYLTLSHGETTLNRKFWNEICEMEVSRKARLVSA